jgi:hypothetical protein
MTLLRNGLQHSTVLIALAGARKMASHLDLRVTLLFCPKITFAQLRSLQLLLVDLKSCLQLVVLPEVCVLSSVSFKAFMVGAFPLESVLEQHGLLKACLTFLFALVLFESLLLKSLLLESVLL